MNIIKLKDIIMPESDPNSYLFNKYLKGKYAYWVQMRYIVPMGLYMDEKYNIMIGMKHEGYVACEENIDKLLITNGHIPKPYGSPCLDVYQYMNYVDSKETDRVNNTKEFRMKNNYTSDSDITIEDIKVFRTWLADELLSMDKYENGGQRYDLLNEKQTHIIQYYSNNMYDNTIKILSEFGAQTDYSKGFITTDCGCSHQTNNLSSLYNDSLNICDPVSIYKHNIYLGMIEMFSNIEFWTQWDPEFVLVVKKYIDNIIKLNLPLSKSSYNSDFNDCVCGSSDDNELNNILVRLSQSMGYIGNNDIKGHKNYISDALRDWSTHLYEHMYWK